MVQMMISFFVKIIMYICIGKGGNTPAFSPTIAPRETLPYTRDKSVCRIKRIIIVPLIVL